MGQSKQACTDSRLETIKEERRNDSVKTSALILADSVGTGVLSLPRALAQLGWSYGLLSLGISAPAFWFAGYLVMHGHLHVPGSRTYGDIGGALIGAAGRVHGYLLVYTLAFMATAGYILTIANSIQQIFYESHLCVPEASLAALCLLLPGLQIRSLHHLAAQSVASFLVLLVVIAVCLFFLLSDGARCDGGELATLDFWGAFSSVGSFIWAYAGVSYYPEILSEMRQPEDFARKPLMAAISVMTGLYALVSVLTFGRCGADTPDSIVLVIPKGPWLRFSSALMIYHLCITYLLNSIVLTRGIVGMLGLERALEPGLRGRAMWAGIAVPLACGGVMFAQVVPQFDNLNGLVGNVCCTQGCLILPALFFLLLQRAAPWPKRGVLTSSLVALAWPMLVSGLFLLVAGTVSSVITIWQDSHTGAGRPFACQALA
jgi:vesicular inhibitory amino acid transporter